ncbi:Cytochrome P450 [Musa troglodytarum]|uniref:Cytochrome P450 n=1 Tax=Musa troglodytarum TaxID=320322 RepID=A0A9E7GJK0_9LILI|nr:Cytochrome P450 [Musa troglodytarum]
MDDIIRQLLRIKDHGDLSLHSIKAVIQDIFVGGIETSSTTLEWAMSELMRTPETMKRAQEEVREAMRGKGKVEERDAGGLSYLKLVIKETETAYASALADPETRQGDVAGAGIQHTGRKQGLRQCLGNGEGPNILGRRRRALPAGEVPRKPGRLQAGQLRVHTLRSWEEDVPRHAVCVGGRGAGAGSSSLLLRLGTPPWHAARRSGHDTEYGGNCISEIRAVLACCSSHPSP